MSLKEAREKGIITDEIIDQSIRIGLKLKTGKMPQKSIKSREELDAFYKKIQE